MLSLRASVRALRPCAASARAARASRSFTSSPIARADVEVTVDGIKVMVPAGSAVIQACELAGVTVPRYCYHEKLAVAGNCRMCLVDVERSPKMAASCSFPVANGMVVHTNSERVKKAREGVTEMILGNHPLDCPVCDQGGECDLQDQTMRYGRDRGRFTEIVGKRAVEDKDIGPLVKTSMNRCIQCTRCVRFMNDIAGAPEFGTSGRGNEMQIGTYLERNINTELSGNIADLCPVGALTSKPYAFRARPWELKKTESIDVLDAVGSNIRVDSRGVEVMRVLPRLNDEVNEEWLADKSRYAVDGLKTQRLTTPLIRTGDRFEPASWDKALSTIAAAYNRLGVSGNEFKAVAGALVDVEAMVALKDLANSLGSENLTTDLPHTVPAHGVDFRTAYTFNSAITGIDEADQILLVGTNPRFEAALINARIRGRFLKSDVEISLVGEAFDSTFWVDHLGTSFKDLKKALSGALGKKLTAAKRPMIIIGSAIVDHPDAAAFFNLLAKFANDSGNIVTPEWNGYNVLQREAARTGAYDVGFATLSEEVASTTPKMIYLLGADEISGKDIPKDAFVIYQGHHGDVGASLADVVLPGAAYTEQTATYVNTEGRVQSTRAAVAPPGVARDNWAIVRAVSEYLGTPLPYEDQYEIKGRLNDVAPHLVRHDSIESSSSELAKLALEAVVKSTAKPKVSDEPLVAPITNYYFTDVISRSSPTMAKCVQRFGERNEKDGIKHLAASA